MGAEMKKEEEGEETALECCCAICYTNSYDDTFCSEAHFAFQCGMR